ncbi:hypothetical protein [Rothia endophytica]|uniref:hypothetical protein n=1 Tax=Rothia endophytica TaxID=1324766 RepID=UPI001F3DDFCE|nr:hypothetical protein [Rothia endophytica]
MSIIGISDEGKLTLAQKTIGQQVKDLGQRAKVEVSQVRVPEFLLFASLLFGQPVPGVGLPFNQLLVFVIVLYAMTHKPLFSTGKWSHLFILFGAILIYIAVVSAFADPSEYAANWTRRWLRLAVSTLLIYVIAVGQIHLRSAILGYSTALVVNAALFFAGIAPDTYGGYLTGYLGDKNFAGLVHALFALLIMTAYTKRWQQVTVFLISCGLLWTTGSRTSLGALVFAYLWILIAPRLIPVAKVALLGVFWWLLGFLTEDYSQAEVFGDRIGSDELRERIDTMSWAKVQDTGFFGQGLGEAYVYDVIDERTWFFHNSYWSAFVEGGWPWAVALAAITLFVAVRPLSKNPGWNKYQIVAQGLGIALLVCALRLGEVFYTLPWAICMGYVLRVAITARYENNNMFGYDRIIEERKF